METDRAVFASVAALADRHRAAGAGAPETSLTAFELRGFSQNGEDGVIAELLRRVGVASRYFVEFGIETGREGNCVFLADVLGWPGLFLEADEHSYAALARKYWARRDVTTLKAAVSPENVNELFKQAGVPPEPDVVSIDVDGPDFWIWEALSTCRPRLVVCEYNSALPPGRQLVQPRERRSAWDGTDFYGASLDALEVLARRKRYRLVHSETSGVNAFFVRDDLAPELLPQAEAVRRVHEPNLYLQGKRHPPDPQSRSYVDLAAPGGRSQPRRRPETRPPTPDLHSRPALSAPTHERAVELAARTDFIWHQCFELSPGVSTPGVSNVPFLLDIAGVPERLDGATVLDIGTTNGGAAFECERRGAERVLAVDIADADWFGFATLKQALESEVEHVQGSIYELPELLQQQFDVVLFWGVLYHLRHPLLALDNLRRLTRGTASIETAVCDHELHHHRELPLARFYRTDELGRDPSNWFAPTVAALQDWCHSCGLAPTRVEAWPDPAPSRAMIVASAVAGAPEYAGISYERPLRCSVAEHGADFGR
ncbi:MAG: DUF1698 domain-containing protein [Actinomycetota bacterium]|nr:DUF1698 domain-containing protein [Actinomycetota bacterium]